eukprot:CAMPEP_0171088032 /NCGR_PEP_ID=MMETSP0766_2-20121228/20523_1 /TAXON_ID=439317 /ORGANISM="Gambierdiscus australes, Strain CAWD 149" /LENGTH=172 /DNA_ID=CAMNT_0011545787 /DNA_START=40 /DNA_END=558 /DNA_ORIENTATION=+
MGGPAIIDGQPVDSSDNFFVAPFVLDGIEWPTTEHYYQAAKFASDDPLVAEIRAAETANKAWSVGQRPGTIRPDWEHIKVNVMYRAVAAKYAAHPELAAELAATSGRIVAGVSTADWQHTNALILERVREELRPAEQRSRRYAALVSLTEPRLQGEAAVAALRAHGSEVAAH